MTTDFLSPRACDTDSRLARHGNEASEFAKERWHWMAAVGTGCALYSAGYCPHRRSKGSRVRSFAVIFSAAALLLGCSTSSGPWRPMHDFPGRDEPPSMPLSAVDRECRSVAQQRAHDARANGFDQKTADDIFEGTLQDCLTWHAKHTALSNASSSAQAREQAP